MFGSTVCEPVNFIVSLREISPPTKALPTVSISPVVTFTLALP